MGERTEPLFDSRCDARTLVHDCQREGPHNVHDCSVCGVFWVTRYDDEGNPFGVEVSR